MSLVNFNSFINGCPFLTVANQKNIMYSLAYLFGFEANAFSNWPIDGPLFTTFHGLVGGTLNVFALNLLVNYLVPDDKIFLISLIYGGALSLNLFRRLVRTTTYLYRYMFPSKRTSSGTLDPTIVKFIIDQIAKLLESKGVKITSDQTKDDVKKDDVTKDDVTKDDLTKETDDTNVVETDQDNDEAKAEQDTDSTTDTVDLTVDESDAVTN